MRALRDIALADLVTEWEHYRNLVEEAGGQDAWYVDYLSEKRDHLDSEISRRRKASTAAGLTIRAESSYRRGDIDAVKAAVDLVDLVSERTELKNHGRSWRGRCPIHGGENPTSLSVYQHDGQWFWKCHACQAGGDTISWLEEAEGATFLEALGILADRAGVQLERNSEAPSVSLNGKNEPAGKPQDPPEGWTKYLSDAILEDDHFAVDAGKYLYRYADGVYRGDGKDWIARRCKTILEDLGRPEKWTTYRVGQVTAYIAVDRPALWERPPDDILNVKNGLLDLETGELRPHTPEHLSTVQIPVDYDPDAACPAWEKFVGEVFPEDCQSTLPWELAAWLMTPNTSIQKSILLLGEGCNGKSTFLVALEKFLGKQNVAGVSLHKLEASQFASARLVGKLANICPDLPSEHLAGTSVFKALTGGDLIHGERKYGESFEFESYARLVFSANTPPQSADSSHAFFRRWLVVPFDRTFTEEDEIPRDVLDRRLADPEELSGVLNMALIFYPRIKHVSVTETESMRRAWYEFREVTDPIEVWLDLNTVEKPVAYIVKADLLRAYNEDAKANGRPVMVASQFAKAVKRWKSDIQDGQKRINGKRNWVWRGIGLVQEGDIT